MYFGKYGSHTLPIIMGYIHMHQQAHKKNIPQ